MRRTTNMLVVMVVLLTGGMFFWPRGTFAAKGDPANGKKLFLTYCFVCHGKTGKGDGIAAKNLPAKPRNLTDDAYMSQRTDEQLFQAISKGGRAFHGSIAMPYWEESLTPQQIWDLVAYIRTLHRKPPQGDAARGAQLYTRYCWTCHGVTGKGNGPLAPVYQPRPRDFTNAAYMATRSDYDLFFAISEGGPAVDRSPAMPAWGHVLQPQEIWDLVAYIRHLARPGQQ